MKGTRKGLQIVAQRVMEKVKSRRFSLGLHVDGSRYGIVDPCVSGDESSVQNRCSEEVDGRMDMSEVVGMAS